MRKAAWIGAFAAAVLGAGGAVVALRPQRQWSSPSRAAVAEVELGRLAEMKLYMNDATAHYEKALEIDPGFVAAKLLLARSLEGSDRPRITALIADVRRADQKTLTANEQFLVSYTLARFDHRPQDATKELDAYLDAHPRDAAALYARCTEEWLKPDWDAAERCNRELLTLDPNWVVAYNYLGYIAMAQGRFAEAEKDFLAYKYIAPDQANPYDSLGELHIVTGQYHEARSEFDEALRLRPDFCSSYDHLLLLAELSRDAALADEVLSRAAGGGMCPAKQIETLRCAVTQWQRIFAGDLDGAWAATAGECHDGTGDHIVISHRVAALTGRLAEARALEAKVGDADEKSAASEPGRSGSATSLHLRGVRAIVEGRPADAVPLLEEADLALAYRGDGQGVFKLVNRLTLAEALRAAGAAARADEVAASVAAVNPRIAELFDPRGPLSLARPAAARR